MKQSSFIPQITSAEFWYKVFQDIIACDTGKQHGISHPVLVEHVKDSFFVLFVFLPQYIKSLPRYNGYMMA